MATTELGYPNQFVGIGSQAISTVKPPNPSCFGSIDHAAERVDALANRVERLVERLAGSYPEPDGPCAPEKPNGLLDAAEDRAQQISLNVSRALAALDRLDKRLP